jgi:hypothetical protein
MKERMQKISNHFDNYLGKDRTEMLLQQDYWVILIMDLCYWVLVLSPG